MLTSMPRRTNTLLSRGKNNRDLFFGDQTVLTFLGTNALERILSNNIQGCFNKLKLTLCLRESLSDDKHDLEG